MKTLMAWIEAMRLRTLPVSLAGVIYAVGITLKSDCFAWAPALMCFAFALLAQIASNFANEYYDYRDGLDRQGREGPRRGVTEGDISPRAMLAATFITLGIACATGVTLVALYGRWWMYVAGIVTALGVVAYSAGPWPLSRIGLGEVAVVVFFGVVPVTLTCLLMMPQVSSGIILASVGVGLMGANVLIVNNYRDTDDDRAVGKRTLAVRLGRIFVSRLYLINGFVAVILTFSLWLALPPSTWIVPIAYLVIHVTLYRALITRQGRALNPLLGMTALLMLAYSLGYLLA